MCESLPTFLMVKVKPMNKIFPMLKRYASIVVILLCSIDAVAQNNVDQLTKQWLELDKSANQLSQDWQQEQQQLALRISLLSHQNKILREKIKRTNSQKDQVNQQRQDILTKQTFIEQSVAQYRQKLPSLLNQLQRLISSLPTYLQKQLASELEQASMQKELTKQYQSIANIVKQVTKNSELIQLKQGLIHLGEQELLTQQLYFGHDQAWFITQDNSRAGIGFRKNNQWLWQEDSQYADNIHQAISHAKSQMPGPLLSLPVYLDTQK